MKNKFFFLSIILFLIISLNACYYDNLEELTIKYSTECDTTTVTYTKDIEPIIKSSCMPCHSNATKNGGLAFEDFTSTKILAETGKLYGSIVWDGSANPMPKGATNKLDNCIAIKVKKWIDSGYTQ